MNVCSYSGNGNFIHYGNFTSNLFPEGFANVGVLFTDVTRHQSAVVRQSQSHAQRVVARVHACNMGPSNEMNERCGSYRFHSDQLDALTDLYHFLGFYYFCQIGHELRLLAGDHHGVGGVFHGPLKTRL